jgi:hypothetical protein
VLYTSLQPIPVRAQKAKSQCEKKRMMDCEFQVNVLGRPDQVGLIRRYLEPWDWRWSHPPAKLPSQTSLNFARDSLLPTSVSSRSVHSRKGSCKASRRQPQARGCISRRLQTAGGPCFTGSLLSISIEVMGSLERHAPPPLSRDSKAFGLACCWLKTAAE